MQPDRLLLNFAVVLLTVMQVAVLIRVLLSWFPIDPYNPIVRVLFEITEPVLAPFRKVVPRIGMFDLSPLAALLVISFVLRGLGGGSIF